VRANNAVHAHVHIHVDIKETSGQKLQVVVLHALAVYTEVCYSQKDYCGEHGTCILGIDEGKLTVDLPTDLGGIGVAMMK
jgi:hypothetical protein